MAADPLRSLIAGDEQPAPTQNLPIVRSPTKKGQLTKEAMLGYSDLADTLKQLKDLTPDLIPGSKAHQRNLADIAEAEKAIKQSGQPTAPSTIATQPSDPLRALISGEQPQQPILPSTGAGGGRGGQGGATAAELKANAPQPSNIDVLEAKRQQLIKTFQDSFQNNQSAPINQQQGQFISEVPRTIVQNLGATSIAGLAGIAGTILPGPEGQGAEWVNKVQQALSYEPTSPTTKSVITALGLPQEYLVNPVAEAAGGALAEKGYPASGAITKAAIETAPGLLGLRKGTTPLGTQSFVQPGIRAASEVPAVMRKPANMTTQQLADMQAAFEAKKAALAPAPAAAPTPTAALPTAANLSAGAAAVDKPTAVNALAAEASPELAQMLKNSNPNKVNLEAGQTALLEDKYGINLSRGQRTGQGYADEWNNRGAHPETIGPLFENQPAQVKSALEKVRDDIAPDIRNYGVNDIGQAEINGFLKNDVARQEKISNAYGDLKNKYNDLRQQKGLAPTDQFPVDGLKFIENAKNKLGEELLSNDVPESLQKTLTQIEEANGQMTFDKFLKLNQRLGQYMKEGKGSERAAAFVIRQELQKIPLVGDAAILKPLADKAIALAKERFDTIRDVPGYKQAVKEAVSAKDAAEEIGSAGADTFHNKYVTKGSRADIQRMIRELGQDSEAHQAMKAGEIEALKKASGVSGDLLNLTPKGLHDYLYNQREKLLDLHGAEGAKSLNEINFLTNKIAQPKTKVFNYSNTLSGQIAEMAKQAGATGLEAMAAKGTGGMSIPIVQLGKGWFANRQKEQFGRNAAAKYSGVIED